VQSGSRLTREFFDRPCLEVAPDLLGTHLVRRLPGGERLVGRIVEVEAYLGDGSDPGSHSHRGQTPRNRAMFGAPGRLYAYRIYGIHICANVVCEPSGSGAAVLVRAVEPLEGIETMRRNRGLRAEQSAREIARGPGRLAQALQIDLSQDGTSLLRGAIGLWRPPGALSGGCVARSSRIGLSKGASLPYRFYEPNSPWVCPLPRRVAQTPAGGPRNEAGSASR
jgi:DNA-3-methyladenine glycosylase